MALIVINIGTAYNQFWHRHPCVEYSTVCVHNKHTTPFKRPGAKLRHEHIDFDPTAITRAKKEASAKLREMLKNDFTLTKDWLTKLLFEVKYTHTYTRTHMNT